MTGNDKKPCLLEKESAIPWNFIGGMVHRLLRLCYPVCQPPRQNQNWRFSSRFLVCATRINLCLCRVNFRLCLSDEPPR